MGYHYDIIVKTRVNIYDINSNVISDDIDPTKIEMDRVFDIKDIVELVMTKNIDGSQLPMAQLYLAGINKEFAEAFKDNKLYFEIDILQDNELIYRNFYKAFNVVIKPTQRKTTLHAFDGIFYLESFFSFNFRHEKALNLISFDKSNDTGFIRSNDLFIEQVPKIIRENYGEIKIENYLVNNTSSTAYKTLLFDSSDPDFKNLNNFLKKYRITLNPFMWGIDEGYSFQEDRYSSKLLFVDLLTTESNLTVPEKTINFLQDSQMLKLANPEIVSGEAYYTPSELKRLFGSSIIMKNTIDNSISKFDPLLNQTYVSSIYKKDENGLPFLETMPGQNSLTIMETTLSKLDFKKYLDMRVLLYNRRPTFQTLKLNYADIGCFMLGRKFPSNIISNDNIIIAADMYFTPSSEENSIVSHQNVLSTKGNFFCHGVSKLLVYGN